MITAYRESTLDPFKSGGLYQWTNPTWKELGGNPADEQKVDAQVEMLAKMEGGDRRTNKAVCAGHEKSRAFTRHIAAQAGQRTFPLARPSATARQGLRISAANQSRVDAATSQPSARTLRQGGPAADALRQKLGWITSAVDERLRDLGLDPDAEPNARVAAVSDLKRASDLAQAADPNNRLGARDVAHLAASLSPSIAESDGDNAVDDETSPATPRQPTGGDLLQWAGEGPGQMQTEGEDSESQRTPNEEAGADTPLLVKTAYYPTDRMTPRRRDNRVHGRWSAAQYPASHGQDLDDSRGRQSIQSAFSSGKGGNYWVDPQTMKMEGGIDIGRQIQQSIDHNGSMRGILRLAERSRGHAIGFSWPRKAFQDSRLKPNRRSVGRFSGDVRGVLRLDPVNRTWRVDGVIDLIPDDFNWNPDERTGLGNAEIRMGGEFYDLPDSGLQHGKWVGIKRNRDGATIHLKYNRRYHFYTQGVY